MMIVWTVVLVSILVTTTGAAPTENGSVVPVKVEFEKIALPPPIEQAANASVDKTEDRSDGGYRSDEDASSVQEENRGSAGGDNISDSLREQSMEKNETEEARRPSNVNEGSKNQTDDLDDEPGVQGSLAASDGNPDGGDLPSKNLGEEILDVAKKVIDSVRSASRPFLSVNEDEGPAKNVSAENAEGQNVTDPEGATNMTKEEAQQNEPEVVEKAAKIGGEENASSPVEEVEKLQVKKEEIKPQADEPVVPDQKVEVPAVVQSEGKIGAIEASTGIKKSWTSGSSKGMQKGEAPVASTGMQKGGAPVAPLKSKIGAIEASTGIKKSWTSGSSKGMQKGEAPVASTGIQKDEIPVVLAKGEEGADEQKDQQEQPAPANVTEPEIKPKHEPVLSSEGVKKPEVNVETKNEKESPVNEQDQAQPTGKPASKVKPSWKPAQESKAAVKKQQENPKPAHETQHVDPKKEHAVPEPLSVEKPVKKAVPVKKEAELPAGQAEKTEVPKQVQEVDAPVQSPADEVNKAANDGNVISEQNNQIQDKETDDV